MLLLADERTAFECIQRLEKFPDCMSIVRVADATPALIGRALDAGASAIIAPMINNAQDAKKLIEQCRYDIKNTARLKKFRMYPKTVLKL